MNKHLQKYLFCSLVFFSLVFALSNCANPISPTGGPKDEQPPRIDTLESTPNLQTNFNARSFELTFDEWVVLEDIRNQVVVSPPLDFELSLKKRTVIFEIEEGDSLRTNTTYTVNFGEAIKDLTEKNPAENLRFVFSTGPVLDSLKLSGMLYDVLTRKPVEEALFMLYENQADSVVRTLRPYYFGRTNKQGQFVIENLKPGTFKGFALKGGGASSYLYSNIGAEIGFPDTLLEIRPGVVQDLEIPLFVEQRIPRINSRDLRTYGQAKLIFNQEEPEGIELIIPDSIQLTTFSEVVKDTFKLWYDDLADTSFTFIALKDTLLRDTIEVKLPNRQAFVNGTRLLRANKQMQGAVKLAPRQMIELDWNHPLAVIDTSRIFIIKDSIRYSPSKVYLDSLKFRRLHVEYAFKQDSSYALLIEPGGLFDIFDVPNDTLSLDIKIGKTDEYGNIILDIINLDSTQNYLGELIQGSVLVDTFYINEKSNFKYNKNLLKPSKYKVRLIEDRNGNRKWDTGSYDLKRQPELIYTKELEQLRANWDQEVTVSLTELKEIEIKEEPPNRNSNRSSSSRNN